MKSCRPSAASPTPPNAEAHTRAAVVAVAYSGGRDSTALLHATVQAALGSEVRVVALHVNHGLSPHADAWQAGCEAQCRRWARHGHALSFVATRIEERPAKGDSIEAWARRMRHTALQVMATEQGAGVLLLAHHRRDQAETLLLQALRGAGLAGLAAMPRETVRDGLTWARPWLDTPREAIEAYAKRHRLRWLDDDSNDDTRLARNRLRLQVWPALLEAFPDAEGSLAQASAWAQEAMTIAGEVARGDLAQMSSSAGLAVTDWQAMPTARRSLVLRAWLQAASGAAPSASLVVRLLDELPATRNGAMWPFGDGWLRRVANRLRFEPASDRPCEPTSPVRVDPSVREATLMVRRAGRHVLPGWGGCLQVRRVRAGGVPLAWLGHLELRPREGGEQFQAGLGRPPRSLKKQYQAAGITAVDRRGPLVFSGGLLVYVPGLGIDARMLALPGQPQVSLQWLPDGTASTAG